MARGIYPAKITSTDQDQGGPTSLKKKKTNPVDRTLLNNSSSRVGRIPWCVVYYSFYCCCTVFDTAVRAWIRGQQRRPSWGGRNPHHPKKSGGVDGRRGCRKAAVGVSASIAPPLVFVLLWGASRSGSLCNGSPAALRPDNK